MRNACSLCENVISASQPCPSGQTPGNSSLRYMQLPPVGLANISGSTGGTEKPRAMVQKPSASIALPPQSHAGAFPTLVQDTIKLKVRGANQQCSTLRNAAKTEEIPLRLLRRHWICLALFRSLFLPLSGSANLGAIICALLPTGITEGQGHAEGQRDDLPSRCGMRDSRHQKGASHSILHQPGWSLGVHPLCEAHTESSAISSHQWGCATPSVLLSPTQQKTVNDPYLVTSSSSSSE